MSPANMNPVQPAFVWTDSAGQGRNRWALFRRSFKLAAGPSAGCMLHLFADARYRLIVNGVTLGHGPARFFIASPECDSCDLTSHLRRGQNVIATLVNSYNAISFHTDLSTAGLCAWGLMHDIAGNEENIRTDDCQWKAFESPGHNPNTHYLSFALAPAECLDAQMMPADWRSPDFDDSTWKPAVIRQAARLGELRQRSIPMPDESPVRPTQQLGIWAAMPLPGERMHSLFATTTGGKSLHTNVRVAVLVYLHSSRAQEVMPGSWWGKHWLNGLELKGHNRDDLGMRQDFACDLHEGRNTLLVFERLGCDFFDFTLGIPESAGIKLEFNVGARGRMMLRMQLKKCGGPLRYCPASWGLGSLGQSIGVRHSP